MIVVKTHIVKKGDTLWGIAEKYLGDGSRYPEIMKRNSLTSSTIQIGQALKISVTEKDPDIKELVKKCVESVENLPEFKKLCELLKG